MEDGFGAEVGYNCDVPKKAKKANVGVSYSVERIKDIPIALLMQSKSCISGSISVPVSLTFKTLIPITLPNLRDGSDREKLEKMMQDKIEEKMKRFQENGELTQRLLETITRAIAEEAQGVIAIIM